MSDRIVCLVGSSRFKALFHEEAARLEKSGVLVLMMGFFQHADGVGVSAEERAVLRRVDRRRIDLSTEVLVINGLLPRCPACKRWWRYEGGLPWADCDCGPAVESAPYAGADTREEIAYALSQGKPVRYLHGPGKGAADA